MRKCSKFLEKSDLSVEFLVEYGDGNDPFFLNGEGERHGERVSRTLVLVQMRRVSVRKERSSDMRA